jgi:hypothetical protein
MRNVRKISCNEANRLVKFVLKISRPVGIQMIALIDNKLNSQKNKNL